MNTLPSLISFPKPLLHRVVCCVPQGEGRSLNTAECIVKGIFTRNSGSYELATGTLQGKQLGDRLHIKTPHGLLILNANMVDVSN